MPQGAESDRSDRQTAAKGAGGEGLRKRPQQGTAPDRKFRGGLLFSGGGTPPGLEALAVLALMLLISLAIRSFDLDLTVSRWFYRTELDPAWWGKGLPLLEFLYRHGTLPANLAGGLGLLGLVVSLFRKGLRRHRRAFALLFLTLVVGPGLLVNGVGKEHWGRPRPREVVQFGGNEGFLPVGAIDWNAEGESFPSGHASVGFYFFALGFLWRARRPRASTAGFAAGLGAGSLLGFQRLAVGAHFLSDIVWSGGVVYLTALGVDCAVSAASRRSREG